MRQHLILGTLAILPFVLVGCSGQRPNAADTFRAQLDDDWKYWMSQYPEVATAVGYPGQNARWTDYSPTAIDARAAYLKQRVERLSRIDRAALGVDDQITYDLYRDLLDDAAKGLAFHNDAMPVRGVIPHNLLMPMNQIEGLQQDVPNVIAQMPTATREDYENIIARLERIGPLVDQTIALMNQGMAAGMTPPRITFRDVPDQVKAQIVADPLQSPLLDAFKTWPSASASAIPEGDRSALTTRATTAYRQSVVPAFTKLHDFLATKYLPSCRETISVNVLPDGAAMYAYNVKWHTTTGRTPNEIHEIGLAEVKRIRAAMDAVMASAGFRNYEEFKQFLRTDPQFFFKDASSLLTRIVTSRSAPIPSSRTCSAVCRKHLTA